MSLTEILPGVDKVLVTGETGFVGGHLSAWLRSAGKSVVPASRRSGIDILRDRLPLDGVGHVFHAAGRIVVPDAWRDPVGYLEANSFGTARILEQCREAGCGVTLVSAYVYGIPQSLPISETGSVRPNNPYALSKYLAEQVCVFYAQYYGLQAVVVRPFNIYGPGQDERLLIPFIVRQVLDPACRSIEVMDLHPRRDYVHVTDLVEAIVQSTRAQSGAVFNVGSGTAVSVEEIIRLACEIAETDKPYRGKGERRQNEIDTTVADISHIRDAIGWTPRISFARGLRDVIEEMRDRCAA